jgi:hypothetical protein
MGYFSCISPVSQEYSTQGISLMGLKLAARQLDHRSNGEIVATKLRCLIEINPIIEILSSFASAALLSTTGHNNLDCVWFKNSVFRKNINYLHMTYIQMSIFDAQSGVTFFSVPIKLHV